MSGTLRRGKSGAAGAQRPVAPDLVADATSAAVAAAASAVDLSCLQLDVVAVGMGLRFVEIETSQQVCCLHLHLPGWLSICPQRLSQNSKICQQVRAAKRSVVLSGLCCTGTTSVAGMQHHAKTHLLLCEEVLSVTTATPEVPYTYMHCSDEQTCRALTDFALHARYMSQHSTPSAEGMKSVGALNVHRMWCAALVTAAAAALLWGAHALLHS